MSELFLSILNMSLTASYVIIFIMLIRLALKRVPKFISYALWGVAAFRLIIPFSFESMFSLIPWNTNGAPIPRDIIYQQSPQINSGIETADSFVNQLLPIPAAGASVNPLQIYIEIGAYIWILGVVALLVYSFVSIFILNKQLKASRLIEGNIYESKNLKTPFVLGVIKPKIYLPAGISAEERNYILLHEQTHINRKDHIIKILAFFILSIHWFNPLVWIAFILMSRDMELSCDERVLKEMNEDIKKPYANSLLSLATGKHILSGSPLAFSEGNVKGRIKNVMNYKKPTFWVVVIAIILVVVLAIGLSTNPINTAKVTNLSEDELAYFNGDSFFNGDYLNIHNQFLSSLYDKPADINLFELFYCGSGLDETITEDELMAVMEKFEMTMDLDNLPCPCEKNSSRNMDKILKEYMNITLTDTNQVGLEDFVYLSDYDAYYFFHGDTNYRSNINFSNGEREGDVIRLFYSDEFFADGDKVLTLQEKNGRYLFIANQMFSEAITKD
ncbi:MAG: M56 family metallopeptidase [Anaerovoracaceae bacterium]|jgi:beta-lactamase regulating signal transducer with metallopeptidase domain